MDADLTINERIKRLVDFFFKGNTSAMARAVFVKQATLRDIIGERQSMPSYETIRNIIDAASLGINSEWLITGKGAMLKDESFDSLPTDQKIPGNYRLVPLYNLDAVGGLHASNLATLDNQYVEEYVPFEDAREGDASLWVTGESMIPTCPPGSKILIRKVVDWREYFGFGNMFVLLLHDGRRILKEVVKSEEDTKKYVLCKSHNPKYPPEELPKSMIEEVWKVIQVHINKGW